MFAEVFFFYVGREEWGKDVAGLFCFLFIDENWWGETLTELYKQAYFLNVLMKPHAIQEMCPRIHSSVDVI